MKNDVVIVGAGIGGLSAAIRLATQGYAVTLIEAREKAGGLASGFQLGGFTFDAGPYILLDKPGLEWAFGKMQLDLESLQLRQIEHVYQVAAAGAAGVAFDRDINRTADSFEHAFPGSARRYRDFVAKTFRIHQQLQPLTFKSHPSAGDLVRHRALHLAPFMLRSLGSVLEGTGLPPAITNAISIWTHIAGQPLSKAPSPMAFVPGLIHHIGAYYPPGGMQAIPELLISKALSLGVTLKLSTKVKTICTSNNQISGVETQNGEWLPATFVISNASAIGTYLDLVKNSPDSNKRYLEKLPLQSPGICAYLAVKGRNPPYYIRFKLNKGSCVAFVQPGNMEPEKAIDGWYAARLIAPLSHENAAALGPDGQGRLMDELLGDLWWQEGLSGFKVLHQRTTYEWGNEFNLYRNSMNPVMTSRFMLKGRIAHRSPGIRGLYLTGSSTHPGQWVSFCAVSGVLAADCLINDNARAGNKI